jgi:hypothetical protein
MGNNIENPSRNVIFKESNIEFRLAHSLLALTKEISVKYLIVIYKFLARVQVLVIA